MKKKPVGIESILDINSGNIWTLGEYEIAEMWDEGRREEEMIGSEEKLLGIVRLAFDVHHYNPDDPRDVAKYEESGEYATFARAKKEKGYVAIKKRMVKRITDVTYENVRHLDTTHLIELIDQNFGSGWDAIPLAVKDIIESAFEVTTTTLPEKRLHASGGTLEKKKNDGFDVLEVKKGSWIEAIFIKKRELQEKIRLQDPEKYDEEGNRIVLHDEEGELLPDEREEENDEDTQAEDPESLDETFYGTYISEAENKDDDEDGDGHSTESVDDTLE